MRTFASAFAKIAQLVEHNLAKVRVAGSSPVFRSKVVKSLNAAENGTRSLSRCSEAISGSPVFRSFSQESFLPGWWNGRHEGLKILWLHGCAGSSPASGTTE